MYNIVGKAVKNPRKISQESSTGTSNQDVSYFFRQFQSKLMSEKVLLKKRAIWILFHNYTFSVVVIYPKMDCFMQQVFTVEIFKRPKNVPFFQSLARIRTKQLAIIAVLYIIQSSRIFVSKEVFIVFRFFISYRVFSSDFGQRLKFSLISFEPLAAIIGWYLYSKTFLPIGTWIPV